MKFILLSAMLLVFVGCNKKDKSSPEVNRRTTCGDEESLFCGQPLADWEITKKREDFPSKIKLTINDIKVLDECMPISDYIVIQRNATQVFLNIKTFLAPSEATAIIEIEDRGADCSNNAVFYSRSDVALQLSRVGRVNKVIVNLDD
jgi:hypothetical protein